MRPAAAGLGRGRAASTATSRSRSTRRSPTTRDATFEQAKRCTELVDRPNLFVKIPAHGARARRDRGLDRRRALDQRHADLLARALRGRRRGVRPRARAARRGGRRPDARRVGRELLRLARRHRGRQAARRRSAATDLQGSSRSPTPSSPTSTIWRSSPARAGRRSPRQGATAALPVGVDLDEEPGLPRRALRRGADRAGHGEHDAGRDDRAFQDHGEVARDARPRASTRRARCSRELADAGVDYDDVTRHARARRACRSSRTRSRRCSTASTRSARRSSSDR